LTQRIITRQNLRLGAVPDDLAEKILKYVPADVLALFITVDGVISAATDLPQTFSWLIFIAFIFITVLVKYKLTSDDNSPPEWDQIIVAAAAFPIWVLAYGGPFKYLPWYNQAYGAVLVLISTFIVPYILDILDRRRIIQSTIAKNP
jgi:RsiW-degrading membrane proteinase PrsW (M82 family)